FFLSVILPYLSTFVGYIQRLEGTVEPEKQDEIIEQLRMELNKPRRISRLWTYHRRLILRGSIFVYTGAIYVRKNQVTLDAYRAAAKQAPTWKSALNPSPLHQPPQMEPCLWQRGLCH
ncbi:MAG: hypothetical protein NC319_08115, partial [Butyricicoccus sp.]|nr:hypothetical protein [Butyricicoccus sp.]